MGRVTGNVKLADRSDGQLTKIKSSNLLLELEILFIWKSPRLSNEAKNSLEVAGIRSLSFKDGSHKMDDKLKSPRATNTSENLAE